MEVGEEPGSKSFRVRICTNCSKETSFTFPVLRSFNAARLLLQSGPACKAVSACNATVISFTGILTVGVALPGAIEKPPDRPGNIHSEFLTLR